MAEAIHIMVCVLDEKKSVAFYDEALGLTVADRFDSGDFTHIYLRNPEADFEVELTVNKGEPNPSATGAATVTSRP